MIDRPNISGFPQLPQTDRRPVSRWCRGCASEFYSAILDFAERPDLPRGNGVWDLGSAEAAEMAKLAETTYRDVNIGLANQFARFAAEHGINVYDVIEASNY